MPFFSFKDRLIFERPIFSDSYKIKEVTINYKQRNWLLVIASAVQYCHLFLYLLKGTHNYMKKILRESVACE